MKEQQEERNKMIAMLATFGVHAVLLLLFMFIIAWRAPDPPLPEYGIVLNFGTDNDGSGPVQPNETAGSQRPSDDEVEQTKNTQPQDEMKREVVEEVKPQKAEPVQQPTATQQESPVVVKEEKKTETKPVEKPKEQPKETVKPETKPQEKTVEKSTSSNVADKTTTDNKEGKPVSQGDDTNKTGDKGDPKGKIDADALYGRAGGGSSGAGLDMAGWNWDYIPKPNVPNNETGRVVFEIKVDDSGEIISIKTLERSVSLEAENICRKEIEKLTFSKTGTNVPSVTTGRITFVMRSQ